MIEQLTGTLIARTPTTLVVDVHGIGFSLQVSLPASAAYPEIGATVTVPTWMLVKEDEISLFGFADRTERELFLALIGVNGVGPKTAQRILSETTPQALAERIVAGDAAALSKFKGIGKKTAEMLVVQLKGPLSKLGLAQQAAPAAASANPRAAEAVLALVSLGVKEPAAQKAVDQAVREFGDNAATEVLIAGALNKV